MTERISHEEARGSVDILVDATTPAFQLESAREGLLEYITQQQSLEADTVSRAEHEETLARHIDHGAELFAALTETQAQLTALQAELETEKAAVRCYMADLETERARAEEAEATIQRTQGVHISWVHQCEKLRAELAAANARAARLEDAARRVLDQYGFGDVDASPPHQRNAMLTLRAALSTAPQASTEQVPVPGCATPGCIYKGGHLGKCFEPGDVVPASTEQASPSPEVGEVCSCGSPPHYPKPCEPAQPAPGGTECQSCKRPEGRVNHVHGHVFVGWGTGWQVCPNCGGTEVDPTPAEPQGRPEQAGDRVDQLRADVARLLRMMETRPATTWSWVADRLEDK